MSSPFLGLSVQDRKLAFNNAALTLRLDPVSASNMFDGLLTVSDQDS
jgi:hypothetical protein